MLTKCLCALVVGLLTSSVAVAAEAKPAGEKPEALKPIPGQIVGRATDSRGNPLASVHVRITGLTNAGRDVSLDARTKADGTYAMPLPEGDYRVSHGWIAVKYNERSYQMPLALADGDTATSFPSGPGIVRDLVWKISGLRDGATDPKSIASYRGAYIKLTRWRDTATDKLWAVDSTIEITLTPAGPLIDGSEGKPVVHKMTDPRYDTWVDIPIGDYTATARLIGPGGQARALRVGISTFNPSAGKYGASARLEFPAEGSNANYTGRRGVEYLTLGIRPD